MTHPFRRLELTFWSALPGFITIALLILCLTPKHFGGIGNFMPLLVLIPIFYWGLQHAREMPYWYVFLIGLINDVATGMPLGISSLAYVCFLGMLRRQRKFIHKEGFFLKWMYFSTLLLVICVLSWVFISLANGRAEHVFPAFMQWLLTVGCYPLFHQLFDMIYNFVNERRWRILHR